MGRMTGVRMALVAVGAACVLQAQAFPAMTLTVRFAPQLPAETVHAILAVTGVTVVAHPQPDTYAVTGKRRARAEQLAELFAAIPGVAGTDPVPPRHPEDQYQPFVVQDQSLQAGTLMLKPQEGAKLDQEQLSKALGASRVEIDPSSGIARIQLPANADLSLARQLAASQPGVASVEGGRPYPIPSGAAQHLGAGGRVMGVIPLQATDVQVQFHPWADDTLQRQFQAVFKAATVTRKSRSVLVVRPSGISAAAAVRAYRLVPAVRHAEPQYGS
jgi:hypothetical protein